ncbi:MAG TPA: acetylglutamate kinase [Acidobacteriota bacterium]|jgi:acetylglutamate kinase
MNIVVKLGGSLLVEQTRWAPLLEQLLELQRQGHRCLLVHGGGKLLTAHLEKSGIASRFVQGLRVTDAQTRDAALMVMGGLLNKKLVTEIQKLGGRALGLCGDGGLVIARKSSAGTTGGADLGYVGEVEHVDGRLMEELAALGLIVVLASLAADRSGEYYNINADLLAAACAAALQADRLIFLTDVAGVLDSSGKTLETLTRSDIDRLIAQGVVAGGMLPKLQSCLMALEKGVRRVRIVPGYVERGLLASMEMSSASRGTEIR